jgi:hypothetical protein
VKHWETHPEYVKGCQPCKWATLNMGTAEFTMERKGEGPMGNDGTRAYVRNMFESRRAAGMTDPIPSTPAAAKFAPAMGMQRDKKYRKINGGL